MKTILLSFILVLSTFTGLAQGRVSIANDSLRLFEIASPLIGDPFGPIQNGPLPSGNIIVLALYAGTTSGSLTLQTSYAVTGANYLAPGRTATKALTLTGVPGGVPQFFQIILTEHDTAWPNTIGAMSEGEMRILLGAEYYGSSGLFTFTPSTSAIAAPLLNGPGSTWQTGSVYITATPEPSAIALFGLGAGGLMLFRVRKCALKNS